MRHSNSAITAYFTSLAVLLLLLLQQAAAASADAWRSQIIYFLLTDRFAPSPGVTPAQCQHSDWNNGTWAGITHNLDLLQDMGMTAIWITPIPYQYRGNTFEGSSYHGYWAQDFSRVEPHYGTDQDLKDMISAAHKRGMLTMLDIVANHASPADGHNVSFITPFNLPEHYNSCDGCTESCSISKEAYDGEQAWPHKPEAELVRKCRLIYLADLNQTHPFVRQQLVSWLKDTLHKFPFDAIRIDTVKHVDRDFWTDLTNAVDLFSIGEVLHGNTQVMQQYLKPGPDGRQSMDSVLNFPMWYKLTDVFAYQKDMRMLLSELQLQRKVLGADVLPLLGNFLDNHDFPRFLELQPDLSLFKNGLAWVLLAEGIPIIYYGSAAGMRGGTDKNAHRQCLWEQPYNTQSDLYRTIGTLSRLRTSRKLWNITDRQETVTADCFSYTLGSDLLVVLTNRGNSSSNATKTCSVQLPASSLLMRKGLTALQDVLDVNQGPDMRPQGVSWNAASRTLTISTPGGNPRVFTSTRFTASFHGGSNPSFIRSSQDFNKALSEKDEVQIQWGRAPNSRSSASGAAAGSWWWRAAAAAMALAAHVL